MKNPFEKITGVYFTHNKKSGAYKHTFRVQNKVILQPFFKTGRTDLYTLSNATPEQYEATLNKYLACVDALKSGQFTEDLQRKINAAQVKIEESEKNMLFAVIQEHIRKDPIIKRESINQLHVIMGELGRDLDIKSIDHQWVDQWIEFHKHVKKRKPSTIRKYVGSLARALDYARRLYMIDFNPLRDLPNGYSDYSHSDMVAVGGKIITDSERSTRLEAGEQNKILNVIEQLDIKNKAAVRFIFILATESAMRMREMYTLTLNQFNVKECTVYLEKTKNGQRRNIPLSRTAIKAFIKYKEHVLAESDGMGDFHFKDNKLFPFLNINPSVIPATLCEIEIYKRRLDTATTKISRTFNRIFKAAGIKGLCFHDLRHEAVSRFHELTDMSEQEIMSITGHGSSRMLRKYTNLRASDLAKRLN